MVVPAKYNKAYNRMAMVRAKFKYAVHGNRLNWVWAAPKHLCSSTEEGATISQLYAEAEEKSRFASVFSFVDEADSI